MSLRKPRGRAKKAATPPPDPETFLPLPHLPFHILLALAGADVAHGWAIIKRIEELSAGRAAPSTGSLYLAMVRLEERGLLEQVSAPTEDEDSRRRHYRLTPLGQRVLEAESQRLASLVEHARGHGLVPPRGR